MFIPNARGIRSRTQSLGASGYRQEQLLEHIRALEHALAQARQSHAQLAGKHDSLQRNYRELQEQASVIAKNQQHYQRELSRLQNERAERGEGDEAKSALAGEARPTLAEVEQRIEHLEKRHQRELVQARAESLTRGMAPAMVAYDDLKRALSAAQQSHAEGPILDGLEAVLHNLEQAFAFQEVQVIGALDEAFDPHLHEAIGRVPAPTPTHHQHIAHIVESGFIQGDQLLRPAKVIVYQEA